MIAMTMMKSMKSGFAKINDGKSSNRTLLIRRNKILSRTSRVKKKLVHKAPRRSLRQWKSIDRRP